LPATDLPPPPPDLRAAVAAGMTRALPGGPPDRLGVALSGGGDSVALSWALADWARAHGVALSAVTVDHGLRPGSADEAARAGVLAARLGLPHSVLHWEDGPPPGNLQALARAARQRLIAAWTADCGIGHVALGHTRDDQAETVLLRLARGSGVEGLTAMRPARALGGVIWLRPLLDVGRAELRIALRAAGLDWDDDPSNADPRFDRVKARAALAALAPLGIDAQVLADTAARMAEAADALARAAHDLAGAANLRVDAAGDVRLDRAVLAQAAPDTRERLVGHLLGRLSGNPYRPRRAALRTALAAGLAGHAGTTVHGCVIAAEGSALRLGREWRAVRHLVTEPGAVWDRRWRLEAPGDTTGLHVAALGPQGLAKCPGWPRTGLSRAGLMAAPALWRGGDLVAAPLARPGDAGTATLLHDARALGDGVLFH